MRSYRAEVEIKALTFDIIGTVFDWHGTFSADVPALNARYGRNLDPLAFAEGARRGYNRGVQAFRDGGPWKAPDDILRDPIVALLDAERAPSPEEVDDYAAIWKRLAPWPEVPAALTALHDRYTLAVLSNVSVAVQSALRERSHLPFDHLLSAETARAYKPDPATYELAIRTLGLQPQEIAMVASHTYDLDAAKSHGFRTAFVASPSDPEAPRATYDVVAADFTALARALRSNP